mmetsp:Transcript_8932/g.23226  ORF Transcript_8932/g.23226 Transcript_8932/m.23226 type:complete len:203 (+) Transcript_8932:1016-1624(+)
MSAPRGPPILEPDLPAFSATFVAAFATPDLALKSSWQAINSDAARSNGQKTFILVVNSASSCFGPLFGSFSHSALAWSVASFFASFFVSFFALFFASSFTPVVSLPPFALASSFVFAPVPDEDDDDAAEATTASARCVGWNGCLRCRLRVSMIRAAIDKSDNNASNRVDTGTYVSAAFANAAMLPPLFDAIPRNGRQRPRTR